MTIDYITHFIRQAHKHVGFVWLDLDTEPPGADLMWDEATGITYQKQFCNCSNYCRTISRSLFFDLTCAVLREQPLGAIRFDPVIMRIVDVQGTPLNMVTKGQLSNDPGRAEKIILAMTQGVRVKFSCGDMLIYPHEWPKAVQRFSRPQLHTLVPWLESNKLKVRGVEHPRGYTNHHGGRLVLYKMEQSNYPHADTHARCLGLLKEVLEP